MLRIFIGYDPRQHIAYNVLQFSIARRSSEPVSITPLRIEHTPLKRTGTTPFTYTRFLVPWLCNFEGAALFLDLDILCVDDIAEMLRGLEGSHGAVWVVDTNPKFERAAVMLFNCAHPDNRVLTPEFVETYQGLHTIQWTDNVGFLPKRWNHLVGYDEPSDDVSLIHYTMGVPAHKEVRDCEHADKWLAEHKAMSSTRPWQELMGQTVHAQRLADVHNQSR